MWRMMVWGIILPGISLFTSLLYNLSYDFRPIVVGVSVSLAFVISACISSLRIAIINSIFILLGSIFGGIVFSGTVIIAVVLVGHYCLEKLK
ncbi:MAG: hypothetical protein PVI90_04005 [Desulfobacteraceae bacterium]